MTVPAIPAVTGALNADGANRLWEFPFGFQDKSHIVLYVYDADDEEAVIGEYTVSDPDEDGGTVTYPIPPVAALATGYHVRVGRVTPRGQPNEIGNNGAFLPKTHEDTFDLLSMQIQEIGARLERTFYARDYPDAGVTDYVLPPKTPGAVLVWGANGLENGSQGFTDFSAMITSAQAAAEVALGYAAIAVNAVVQVQELAADIASGGLVNAAELVTYSGTWGAANVGDALNEAKAAVVVEQTDIAALQAAVVALQATVAGLGTGATIPAGLICAWPAASVPAKWVLCFGQTVGKAGSGATLAGAGYEPLFNALGGMTPNTGAEVFATNGTRVIPDLRGRAVIGRDDMGGSAASRVTNAGTGNPGINAIVRGAAAGVDRMTQTIAQMPLHGHPWRVGQAANGSSGGTAIDSTSVSNQGAYTGTPDTTHAIGGSGGNNAMPNVQPSIVLDAIIYTGV